MCAHVCVCVSACVHMHLRVCEKSVGMCLNSILFTNCSLTHSSLMAFLTWMTTSVYKFNKTHKIFLKFLKLYFVCADVWTKSWNLMTNRWNQLLFFKREGEFVNWSDLTEHNRRVKVALFSLIQNVCPNYDDALAAWAFWRASVVVFVALNCRMSTEPGGKSLVCWLFCWWEGFCCMPGRAIQPTCRGHQRREEFWLWSLFGK